MRWEWRQRPIGFVHNESRQRQPLNSHVGLWRSGNRSVGGASARLQLHDCLACKLGETTLNVRMNEFALAPGASRDTLTPHVEQAATQTPTAHWSPQDLCHRGQHVQ